MVHIVAKGNKPATVNKKLRYRRSAMNRAIKRGYAAQNPMDTELFKAVEQKPPRVLTRDEETAILDEAESLRGYRMRAFIYTALNTGGRRAEVLGLTWGRVQLAGDEPHVHFSRTKSHRDRIVPINPNLVAVLRRVQAQTMQAGGPFIGMDDNLGRGWGQIREAVNLVDVTIHDFRRTYITRLIRAGVPLPTVQELAGHADIKTTLKYYNWVSGADKREAVKLLQDHGAG